MCKHTGVHVTYKTTWENDDPRQTAHEKAIFSMVDLSVNANTSWQNTHYDLPTIVPFWTLPTVKTIPITDQYGCLIRPRLDYYYFGMNHAFNTHFFLAVIEMTYPLQSTADLLARKIHSKSIIAFCCYSLGMIVFLLPKKLNQLGRMSSWSADWGAHYPRLPAILLSDETIYFNCVNSLHIGYSRQYLLLNDYI